MEKKNKLKNSEEALQELIQTSIVKIKYTKTIAEV